MITLTTLIIAGLFVAGLLIASVLLPHPATWLAAAVMSALLAFILWPKYQAQQQAQANGVIIQANITDIRHRSRKQEGSTNHDYYEIVAQADNPITGKKQTFVSPPLSFDPQPHLQDHIPVKVDWQHTNAYIMDLSGLPH